MQPTELMAPDMSHGAEASRRRGRGRKRRPVGGREGEQCVEESEEGGKRVGMGHPHAP